MVSKMRYRASLSSSMASRGSPSSTEDTICLRISSRVCRTSTPRAVDRPTAGSASMAKIRASGCVSVKSRTKAADSDVLPTPPLPATARILGFLFNRASRPFWAVCIYMHAVLYKVSGR